MRFKKRSARTLLYEEVVEDLYQLIDAQKIRAASARERID